MTSAAAGDVSLACMQVVVDRFAAHGMRHACLSPGSRSTPIALALDRHPAIAVHVHLDERSSAFFALGIARATASPVAVVCTSGTAAAELFPAAVEATMSHAPLLLLTADRPPEFRSTGANQTIDQRELYGRHAKAFVEAALPTEGPNVAAYWAALATDVIRAAAAPPAGPVQVDLPFPEPLTPSGAAADIGTRPSATMDGIIPAPMGSGSPDGVVDLANNLRGFERGIVLAGAFDTGEAPAIARAAEALGWPLLAEPLSQLRRPGDALSAGQLLLGDAAFLEAHRPELVLQFGRTPTTRSGQAVAASCDRLAVIQCPGTPADPLRRADPTLEGDAEAVASELAKRSSPQPGREWLDAWRTADAVARRSIDELLDRWEEPFEGRIARDLAATIPSRGTLVVGSSMPVRDLDMFMRPREPLRVIANRGASGIDGVVSTALGVAAAAGRAHALIGDLSLLHDAGSLLWSGRRDLDLVVVVPNNDGGIIFSLLDQRTLPEHERLFTTPHGLDLGTLSAAAGIGHERIERASGLVPAIEAAGAAGGVRIVEAAVERDVNLLRRAEIHEAVAAALASIA